jgi:hypothetical protein
MANLTTNQTSRTVNHGNLVRVTASSPLDQQSKTIKIIADGIIRSSRYLPIRNRAARLAAKAGEKDYIGQVKAIYDDFVQSWRYVKDPIGRELVTVNPARVYEQILGGDGRGRGAGDCDDVAVAIGGMLAGIGMPIALATLAPPGMPPGPQMTHVFIRAKVPGHGWLTVDPVVHPRHGLGYTPPHSRMAIWDLTGSLMEQSGNAQGLRGAPEKEDSPMLVKQNFDVSSWQDIAGFGDYAGPQDELLDFRQYGITDFGIYADSLGMLGGLGLAAEVSVDEQGRAWTPAIEVAPTDYEYLSAVGAPYHGMYGMGDDGETYAYDGNLGFFKKLFRRVKKRIKKGISRVKNLGKRLLKKLPGGKYLLKLGKRVWRIAKKIVKPLAKIVGPIAAKLAPVAALIPGYGPAIAAALHTTGKIAKTMTKFGAKLATPKGGGISKLRFPSGGAAKAFQKAIKRQAKRLSREAKAVKRQKRDKVRRSIKKRSYGAKRVPRPARRVARRSYRRSSRRY